MSIISNVKIKIRYYISSLFPIIYQLFNYCLRIENNRYVNRCRQSSQEIINILCTDAEVKFQKISFTNISCLSFLGVFYMHISMLLRLKNTFTCISNGNNIKMSYKLTNLSYRCVIVYYMYPDELPPDGYSCFLLRT